MVGSGIAQSHRSNQLDSSGELFAEVEMIRWNVQLRYFVHVLLL